MVFSSIAFIYYFLPLCILCYFLVPTRFRNKILLIFSLFFYFYGESKYIIVLIFSCIFNYYSGNFILKYPRKKKLILIANLIINFGCLFYFKYFNFFISNINNLLNTELPILQIIMPIGISFFTFQAASYVIDIYKGKVKPAKNVFDFATYLTLFPQLIAGPIVRYETVAEEMENRTTNVQMISAGLKRFIIGLGKKVLIANLLGAFAMSLEALTAPTVLSFWLKALAYTFQIYYDFSGYSDMAIGIGLVFGFHFLENFNYPLIAKSITDFWRRWHISLSSWFKDYVYIPLGGNRLGIKKQIRNILIVWLITGFWHGASWNFVIWGLYFAILLILEKFIWQKFLDKHKVFAHISTFILILFSFIIFQTESLNDIFLTFQNMFNFDLPFTNVETNFYLSNYVVILILAFVGMGPWLKKLYSKIADSKIGKKVLVVVEPIALMVLLLVITSFIIDDSYNPFLYFRF